MRYKKLVKNIVTSMVAVTLVSGFTSVQASTSSTNYDLIDTESVLKGFDGVKTLDEIEKENEEAGIADEVIISSSSAKANIDPSSVKVTTITAVPEVTDAEVKADFRYSLTAAQQGKNDNGYVKTYQKNNALKMRIQLEKMFNTKVDKKGGQGKLYYTYFQVLSTDKHDGAISYDRAYMQSSYSKDVATNKAVLEKLAADTFADVDGTESYASLVPMAVYYGLIDTETVTAEKADKSNGKYKEGDLLVNLKGNLTYADAAKLMCDSKNMIKKSSNSALAKKDYYKYIGVLDSLKHTDNSVVNDTVAAKQITKAEFTTLTVKYKSIAVHATELEKIRSNTFTKYTDAKKCINLNWNDDNLTASGIRAWYMNAIANPTSGIPTDFLAGLNSFKTLGINVSDANGNTNWYKAITKADALNYMHEFARQDM